MIKALTGSRKQEQVIEERSKNSEKERVKYKGKGGVWTDRDIKQMGKKKKKAGIALEVAFDLAEQSVHLNVLLLIQLLTDPGQAGQDNIHEPVRSHLRTQVGPVKTLLNLNMK